MKRSLGLSLALATLLLQSCQHSKKASEPVPAGTKLESLSADASNGAFDQNAQNAQVLLIPQWHLSPQDDTQKNPRVHLPQSPNQIGIYRQLSEWVDQDKLQSLIVEGCEGEIGSQSPLKFNGWTVKDLGELNEKTLDVTLTQVGLKMKARFGDKIRVVCGDNQNLITQHLIVLSDLRGLLGFKARITQLKGEPAKRKDYVSTVRELLKLRPETDDDAVIAALDEELQSKLDRYEALVHERNIHFLAAVKAESQKARIAVVIGSLHVRDLQDRVQASGLSVGVFTPIGLKGSEADLIDQVRALLKKI